MKKQYQSILMMCARQSMYKLLAVLTVMVIWECLLLLKVCSEGESSFTVMCFCVDLGGAFVCAWIAFMIILSKYGCKMKGSTGNLLCRLSVPRKMICVLQGIYNVAAFFILWGVQVMFYMLVAIVGFLRFPEEWGPQTMFIEINDIFLLAAPVQLLIPLTDIGKWIFVLGIIFISAFFTSRRLCTKEEAE